MRTPALALGWELTHTQYAASPARRRHSRSLGFPAFLCGTEDGLGFVMSPSCLNIQAFTPPPLCYGPTAFLPIPMLKSQSPGPPNVTIFGDRVFDFLFLRFFWCGEYHNCFLLCSVS